MKSGHALMIRLNAETYGEFEKWRKKFGITKNSFAAMCIRAGMKSVVRGVEPESAMDPKVIAAVMGQMMKSNRRELDKMFGKKQKA